MGNRRVRLGILLEATTPLDAVCRLATLADRAGLDGIWLRSRPTPRGQATPAPPDVLDTLSAAADRTSAITLGAYLAAVPGPAEVPNGLVDRLEVTTGRSGISHWVHSEVRVVLALTAMPIRGLPPGIHTVVVPATSLATAARPPFAVAVELAASVGRTTAEAAARAERDGRLRGERDPRRGGLFGTLEECQARVAELADAGVTEVRCWIPDTPDVADVIAQLSAAPIGIPDGGRRAQAPAAPADWGGRPRHAG